MAIEVSVVGFDIAKNVFQIHGVDRRGAAVLRRRLRRAQVAEFFPTSPSNGTPGTSMPILKSNIGILIDPMRLSW